jgi:hypothetical protein
MPQFDGDPSRMLSNRFQIRYGIISHGRCMKSITEQHRVVFLQKFSQIFPRGIFLSEKTIILVEMPF